MKLRIGTSGFGVAKPEYFRRFSCVEIQQTFYQPPKLSTLQRWREEAPAEFEFVLKAWQLITHDSKSPTYRRLKRNLSDQEKQEAGYFRDSAIVREAWEFTLAGAKALDAKTILFQCPASFKQTKENISHLEDFFRNLNREENSAGQFRLGWEPRGDWDANVLKKLCEDLGLWHVVDPFVAKSVTPARCYFRLHGRNGWRYEYDEAELRELAAMLSPGSPRSDPPYVFFNNARMTQDALKFQTIVGEMK
jgi:uncharacterized protein YecE (DUF72 family)